MRVPDGRESASGLAAALPDRQQLASRFLIVRSVFLCDPISRTQADEGGTVAMSRVYGLMVFQPFLQTSVLINSGHWYLIKKRRPPLPLLRIHLRNPAGGQQVREDLVDQLKVHRRWTGQGAVPFPSLDSHLRRGTRDRRQAPSLVFDQIILVELTDLLQHGIELVAEEGPVTAVFPMMPENLGDPCAGAGPTKTQVVNIADVTQIANPAP